MAIDTIAVNGNSESWGYLVLKANDERFYGWTKITFGDKLTEALGYSSGRAHAPTRRSQGKYEVEPVKVTGYPDAVQAFRDYIAKLSPTGNSYGAGAPEWEATLFAVLPGSDRPRQVDFRACKWIENTGDHEESPELLKEDFAFQPRWIERDGKVLFDDSDGPT